MAGERRAAAANAASTGPFELTDPKLKFMALLRILKNMGRYRRRRAGTTALIETIADLWHTLHIVVQAGQRLDLIRASRIIAARKAPKVDTGPKLGRPNETGPLLRVYTSYGRIAFVGKLAKWAAKHPVVIETLPSGSLLIRRATEENEGRLVRKIAKQMGFYDRKLAGLFPGEVSVVVFKARYWKANGFWVARQLSPAGREVRAKAV